MNWQTLGTFLKNLKLNLATYYYTHLDPFSAFPDICIPAWFKIGSILCLAGAATYLLGPALQHRCSIFIRNLMNPVSLLDTFDRLILSPERRILLLTSTIELNLHVSTKLKQEMGREQLFDLLGEITKQQVTISNQIAVILEQQKQHNHLLEQSFTFHFFPPR